MNDGTTTWDRPTPILADNSTVVEATESSEYQQQHDEIISSPSRDETSSTTIQGNDEQSVNENTATDDIEFKTPTPKKYDKNIKNKHQILNGRQQV